ncbi:hypothetical protein BdWA1_001211 [Babesia duncani]|uniref:Uncharacterized protein n=1 Tax=Babesia duncani TaxID=323732 RepID=A0AAD9PNQ8_9APIC|nr:hypothetical protein BdWA1_001211 [Babesia duncani]
MPLVFAPGSFQKFCNMDRNYRDDALMVAPVGDIQPSAPPLMAINMSGPSGRGHVQPGIHADYPVMPENPKIQKIIPIKLNVPLSSLRAHSDLLQSDPIPIVSRNYCRARWVKTIAVTLFVMIMISILYAIVKTTIEHGGI